MQLTKLFLLPLFAAAMSSTALAQTEPAGLRVGTAKVDITPDPNPDYPALNEFDHEKLALRVIVLDNGKDRAALIGADLGGINEEVWADASQRISTEFDIPVANIVMSSTHTHSDYPANATTAPGTPRYGTEFVADVAVEAIRDAIANLEPASVGYGTGSVDLNVNRDAISATTRLWTQAANPEGPTDHEVGVLSFIGEDGQPVAAYVNYAMHPVNGYLAGFVSGDFAAATSRYVEQAFGDEMITIFSQGASGDQNPRWLRTGTNAIASRTGLATSGFEEIREDIEAPLRNKEVDPVPYDPAVAHQLGSYMLSLGIILGEEVIHVMSETDDLQASPEIFGAQDSLICPGRKRLDNAREGVAGEYEAGDDVNIRLGVLGIGDIALATTNAEIYSLIGLRIKEASPLSKVMYVTLANGRALSGYIPDDAAFGHQTFQVLGSRLLQGCADEGIVSGITGLISDYVAR